MRLGPLFLRPHEAVIAPVTGHIEVHEAGAIEATGHKIIPLPGKDGKLRPEDVQEAVDFHLDEHMVKPRLVFISNATEIGSIYTKAELEATGSAFCRPHNLLLYWMEPPGVCPDFPANRMLTLAEGGWLVDAFYILAGQETVP